MKLSSFAILLFMAFTLVSCKKEIDTSEFIISLNGCHSQNIKGKNVEVCYLELLEDSRCPANANCVWQGVAKARFIIKAGEQQKTFELSTLDLYPDYKNQTEELGYTIRLVQILPYPGLGGTIHSAEIEISK